MASVLQQKAYVELGVAPFRLRLEWPSAGCRGQVSAEENFGQPRPAQASPGQRGNPAPDRAQWLPAGN